MENEKQQIEKVVSSKVTTRKKNVLEKAKDAFFAVDFKEAASNGIQKVVIPALQKTAIDIVNSILNTMFFGSSGAKSNYSWWNTTGTTFGYSAPRVDYSSFSNKPVQSTPGIPTYDEIIIADYAEANKVLDSMQAIIDRFGKVTISELYGLVGLPAISSYYNYGWKKLSGASVGVVTGGYLLKLPTAIPL